MSDLAEHTDPIVEKRCAACRGEVPPLDAADASRRLQGLGRGWRIDEGGRLEKAFTFPAFRQALAFVNRVGEVAEAEDHHPEIHLAWRTVRLALWTQAVGALTEIDFALAAKMDTVVESASSRAT